LPHNRRATNGKCDFEKVEGMKGIYLSNYIDNAEQLERSRGNCQANVALFSVIVGLHARTATAAVRLTTASTFADLRPGYIELIETLPEEHAGCGLVDDSKFSFILRTPALTEVNDQELVLEFMGGGACWSFDTCTAKSRGWNGRETTSTWISENLAMQSIVQATVPVEGCTLPIVGGEMWNWCNDAHPYKRWTSIVVPYCTGDIHMGNATTTYFSSNSIINVSETVRHRGAVNARVILRWMKKVFPNLKRIVVAGGSAGGFAACLWSAVVADMWPEARVAGLSDSAMHFPGPSNVSVTAMRMLQTNWNFLNPLTYLSWSSVFTGQGNGSNILSQDFPIYRGTLQDLIPHFSGRLTVGILTSLNDLSAIGFWRLLGGEFSDWKPAVIEELHGLEQSLSPIVLRTFILAAEAHHITSGGGLDMYSTKSQGVGLISWMKALVDCNVPAASGQVWAVGSRATYTGNMAVNCTEPVLNIPRPVQRPGQGSIPVLASTACTGLHWATVLAMMAALLCADTIQQLTCS